MTSADMPTAAMAQSYLMWRDRRVHFCARCGGRDCVNAKMRTTPAETDRKRLENYLAMMPRLHATDGVIKAGLE